MRVFDFVSKDNEGNQNLLKGIGQGQMHESLTVGAAEGCEGIASGTSPFTAFGSSYIGLWITSVLLGLYRTLPAVDVALTGATHGKLGLIHILSDGRTRGGVGAIADGDGCNQ